MKKKLIVMLLVYLLIPLTAYTPITKEKEDPVPIPVVREEELYLLSIPVLDNAPLSATPTLTLTPTPTPTPSPTPTPNPSVYKFSEYEIDLFARLVESEGGIEPYDSKVAIASVVVNRMEHEKFPNTIEGVIYDNNPCPQFSVTIRSKRTGKAPIECEASEDSVKAVLDVMTNGSYLPKGVLTFYADYCTNEWNLRQRVYKKIGTTNFTYMD